MSAGGTGVIDRDGFALGFVREGRGIPMLVVGAPRYYRRALPSALRDHFEIVFCDIRPWVASPDGFDLGTITLDTYADDLEAIRVAAGLERPVVLGHSIHGTIAVEYARRHAHDVRGVVAVGAPPVGTAELWEAVGAFFPQDADAARLAAHERNLATRRNPSALATSQDFIDQYVSNGAMYWYDPEFDAAPLWEGVEVNLPVFFQLIGTVFADYHVEAMDVPVFAALGRYDYSVPFHLWDPVKDALPRLRVELYEKSAHTPPFEQPERFTADVVDWARSR